MYRFFTDSARREIGAYEYDIVSPVVPFSADDGLMLT